MWIEPVHETVNLNPVVYDSDIEIIHRPVGDHSGRDFATFEKAIARDGGLSTRLLNMYLRELYKAGGEGDLERGFDFLSETLGARRTLEDKDELTCRRLIAVLMKCCRLRDDMVGLLKYSLSPEATVPSSEICMELGYFFYGKGDYIEASEWFYRAAYSCEPDMDIGSGDVKAFSALAECYGKLGDTEKAMEYKKMSGD
jgi:tetratricopeptide (TPR) repeat protein